MVLSGDDLLTRPTPYCPSDRAEHSRPAGWAEPGRSKAGRICLIHSYSHPAKRGEVELKSLMRKPWDGAGQILFNYKSCLTMRCYQRSSCSANMIHNPIFSPVRARTGPRCTLLKIRQSPSTNHGKAQQRNYSFDL